MKEISRNQRGAVLVTFAILLVALLGFGALATEAGRWYLVRSELSKAVDAAAMAGAKNISNPYLTVNTIAQEVGNENFPAGQLGTPNSGLAGSVSFTITTLENNKIKVDGRVNAIAILARLFGIDQVATASTGVAQRKEVEIMMTLDKSGSMAGTPIRDLKNAAISFLRFFRETEDKDKMGLISFATGVSVDHSLSTLFVSDMTTKITNLTVYTDKRQFTNAEDAIDRSDNQADGGFTDQSTVPGDQRIQQFLIFFTDGNPNAFRGFFTYQGMVYDAVAYTEGSYGSCTDYICGSDRNLCDPNTGNSIGVPALPTGDGKAVSATSCLLSGHGYGNTKWDVFGEYPPPAPYGPESCSIPESSLRPTWFKNVARQKAIKHAQELKNKHIKIYIIGLGNVDRGFLGQIASGPGYEYYAPTSDQLEGIFNAVAMEIKLRLVS